MHKYRWFSNIKWGRGYDSTTGANYASASDAETLIESRGYNATAKNLQVEIRSSPNGEWRWASEVSRSQGGLIHDQSRDFAERFISDSVAMNKGPHPRKIERRCPRCHRHSYHWLKTGKSVAGCVNCGHEWRCRVMKKDC